MYSGIWEGETANSTKVRKSKGGHCIVDGGWAVRLSAFILQYFHGLFSFNYADRILIIFKQNKFHINSS